MIDISSQELKQLKTAGSGTFGLLYKKDENTLYKIYYPKVYDKDLGQMCTNQTLYKPMHRFRSLINRSKNLKYSGGVLDTIRVDGHFGGVSIPYYNGKLLGEYIDAPLKLRCNMSRQILRNAEELEQHFIYPTDYKLNNIIAGDDHVVHLIDLDDQRTHVAYHPNPVLHFLCMGELGSTLWTFLNQQSRCPLPKGVSKKLQFKQLKFSPRFSKYRDYVDYVEEDRNILLIDDDTDLEQVHNLLKIEHFDVVYLLDVPHNMMITDPNYFHYRIECCKSYNIPIFDFAKKEDLENFLKTCNVQDMIGFEEDQVKVYKKTSK